MGLPPQHSTQSIYITGVKKSHLVVFFAVVYEIHVSILPRRKEIKTTTSCKLQSRKTKKESGDQKASFRRTKTRPFKSLDDFS